MKSVLFYLYLSIAILYVINSGIDLPGSLDNWLHANHEINYLLVGTIYFIIAIIYLNKDYKKEKEKIKEKTKNNKKKCEKEFKKLKNTSIFVKIWMFIIIVILFYCWISMIQNILFKKSNKQVHILH